MDELPVFTNPNERPAPANQVVQNGVEPETHEDRAPTHIMWREGGFEFVNIADGYNPDNPDLAPIPEGVNLEWCKADLINRVLEPDLERVKLMKWEQARAYRDSRRYGGVNTGKGRMQSDPESRGLVDGAVGMADKIGPTFNVNWTMEDNSVVPHDATEIVNAGLAMGYWYATCQDAGSWVRGQINAYTTVDEVLALDHEALFESALAAAYAPNPVP